MKKFVLATKSDALWLSDAHISWLHSHGYPNADAQFCNDDRSNPALVECIEAIHASMQNQVDCAYGLLRQEAELNKKAQPDREKLSAAIDAFVEAVHDAGVNKNSIMIAMLRPGFENWNWESACAYFTSYFGVTVYNAKNAYEEYLSCLNSPAICAWQDTLRELEEFCEANSLKRHSQTIEIDDGYVVKTFDETRFTAKAVPASDEEYEHSHPSFWERMELTPYLTRATVNSFVAEGNTDGLMEYLRSLHLNLNIEA